MILSYNPVLKADTFRLCADRTLNEADLQLMDEADAILLPQEKRPVLYSEAVQRCSLVFPDYSARYSYPGKIGDIVLFDKLSLSHPHTHCFESVSQCPLTYWDSVSFPVVIKGNQGGEGSLVFVVNNRKRALKVLRTLQGMESSGFNGFMVQEWIDAGDRTLRVVVLDTSFVSYWRVQPDPAKKHHNLRNGGFIDHETDRGLQEKGVGLVKELCEQSGINLAGIDVLFDHSQSPPSPLLLEINYYFGREGLGGSFDYYRQLQNAVDTWLKRHGLPLPAKFFDPDSEDDSLFTSSIT